jgi:hypothetical protein
LVAAPLLDSIAKARSRNRESSIISSTGISTRADDADAAINERHKMSNQTLLVGGEYRALIEISECLNVEEIEQV